MVQLHTASFGNVNGSHQFIKSTLPADSKVISEIRFLVDRPSGHLVSEIQWSPYWGCGPVDDYWAIWRGEEDSTAERGNMVKVEVVLARKDEVGSVSDLNVFLQALGYDQQNDIHLPANLFRQLIQSLGTNSKSPVVPDLKLSPVILKTLWPYLWPSMRQTISLRTLFGVDSLSPDITNRVIVIPHEVLPVWRNQNVMTTENISDSVFTLWFEDKASPDLKSLVTFNAKNLSNDLSTLQRLDRIALNFKELETNPGSLTAALLILRTIESFNPILYLPEGQYELLKKELSGLQNASVENIRSASLIHLPMFQDKSKFEFALEKWVHEELPKATLKNSIWIIETQLSTKHAAWWCKALQKGLAKGFAELNMEWVDLFWNLSLESQQVFNVLMKLIPESDTAQKKLGDAIPKKIPDSFLPSLIEYCQIRNWPILMALSLGHHRSFKLCIETITQNLKTPELALPIVLKGRNASEIIDAAASVSWASLDNTLPELTLLSPSLLLRVKDLERLKRVLVLHLNAGGDIPSTLLTKTFLIKIFESAMGSDKDSLIIIGKMNAEGGQFLANYSQEMKVWPVIYQLVNQNFLAGATDKWWEYFLSGSITHKPYSELAEVLVSHAVFKLSRKPVKKLLEFLSFFPDISENTLQAWLNDTGFEWGDGDHQGMAHYLNKRGWKVLIKDLRYSWKHELVIVAWYAKDALSWGDRFHHTPSGVNESRKLDSDVIINKPAVKKSKKIQVLFLSANPLSTHRLSLMEELRVIENIAKSKKRKLEVVPNLAVRPSDLQEFILESNPTIVHFSGHGGGEKGLVMHTDDVEGEQLVTGESLAELFKVCGASVRIVVLSSCYSEVQALSIVEHVDFVIGMKDTITDKVAERFSLAFYRGLAYGSSVENAFQLGVNELNLNGLENESLVPTILVKPGMSASDTYLITR